MQDLSGEVMSDFCSDSNEEIGTTGTSRNVTIGGLIDDTIKLIKSWTRPAPKISKITQRIFVFCAITSLMTPLVYAGLTLDARD